MGVWRERRPQRGMKRERETRRRRREWFERFFVGGAAGMESAERVVGVGETEVDAGVEEDRGRRERRPPRFCRRGNPTAPIMPLRGERMARRVSDEVGRFNVVLAKRMAEDERVA